MADNDAIEGWFDFQEIYDRLIAESRPNGVGVEVGCWLGCSFRYLLERAKADGRGINLAAVDTWEGSLSEPYQRLRASQSDIFAEFSRNVDSVQYPYRAIHMHSTDAAKSFPDNSLDFVFIDADHDYRAVSADLQAWWPKVRWGGYIAGHDFASEYSGVQLAVRDYVPLGQLEIVGRSWIFKKQPKSAGKWIRPLPDSTDWPVLFLPYVNRLDLLQNAVRSLQDRRVNVVVIDQSCEGNACDSFDSTPVFRWECGLHFCAMQNWMRLFIEQRGDPFYLFMHSDAEAGPGAIEAVVSEAKKPGIWGIIFANYDALAAFNVLACRTIGCWDETFWWYVSDCDYYMRMMWAEIPRHALDGNVAPVIHHGSRTVANMTPEDAQRVNANHEWAVRHYRHKWGCCWTEGENGRTWTVPYNGSSV